MEVKTEGIPATFYNNSLKIFKHHTIDTSTLVFLLSIYTVTTWITTWITSERIMDWNLAKNSANLWKLVFLPSVFQWQADDIEFDEI